jgi:hypothetical protein
VTYTGAVNGTNAAKNVIANFSQPGIYNFTVNIADPDGQAIASSVQATVLPVFASQSGLSLNVNLNNIAPIAISSAGGSITVVEAGYPISFNGVTSIIVNGCAVGGVLNINSSLPTEATFANTETMILNLNAGSLVIGAGSGLTVSLQQFSAVDIAAGASLTAAQPDTPATRTLLDMQALSLAGSAGNWTGLLDLNGNDLEVQSGDFSTINDQLSQGYYAASGGSWQGSGGIISTAAAVDTTHLSTLGVILNTVDGMPAGRALFTSGNLFDNTTPPSTAILIKDTYYGDTNLDGKVDGSDYSRLDNGLLLGLSGWFNGDLNYDGILNGSDYTLLDNAFNNQGAALSTQVAVPDNARRPTVAAVPMISSTFVAPLVNAGSTKAASGVPWVDQVMDDSLATD